MIIFKNQIFTGGIRIFHIMDSKGQTIFEEEDESTDSVAPYFLINGAESEDRVRWIWEFIDREIEASLSMAIEMDGETSPVACNFYPAIDGKLTRE